MKGWLSLCVNMQNRMAGIVVPVYAVMQKTEDFTLALKSWRLKPQMP